MEAVLQEVVGAAVALAVALAVVALAAEGPVEVGNDSYSLNDNLHLFRDE